MNIKIWLGNLGKYNEGELVGKWIQLPMTQDELNEVYAEIKLGTFDEDGNYTHGYEEGWSFYEEWYIGDYEMDYRFKIDQYDSIDELNELADNLYNLDQHQLELFAQLYNDNYGTFDNCIEIVKESTFYVGCKTMGDVLQEYKREHGDDELPSHIWDYINWDEWADDFFQDDDFYQFSWGYVEVIS